MINVVDFRDFLSSAIHRRQKQTYGRFTHSTDGVRLVLLGIILELMGGIAFIGPVFGVKITGYVPGTAALFCGALICLIVVRMGRPKFYFDLIMVGILYISLGVILSSNALLVTTFSFLLFSVLFLISATARLWIAATHTIKGKIQLWPLAGGAIGLLCALFIIVSRITSFPINPDVVLATDILFHGLVAAGFGLSLHEERE